MAQRQIAGKDMLAYIGTGSIDGVASVTMTDTGESYEGTPTVSFSGGGGSGAAGYAVMSGGSVASVVITNAGSGYTSAPTIVFSGGGGTGADGDVVLGESYRALICLTSHDLDQTSNTITTDTFCGKISVDGTKDAKFTFNNLVALSPEAGKETIETLQTLYKSGDYRNWKVTTVDMVSGDMIWSFSGFIESAKFSANATDLYNASFSVQLNENGAELEIID